ncbi:MAG: class I SAM-dependent methyltransferase [Rhodospirillaceae bacterium]|nr:class I SAM-dependent methyltransferase [Rhodospirillaceae bacterium]
MSSQAYDTLAKFHRRPEPFAIYSADRLWTDPHIARQMLALHLDPETDVASRRPSSIDAIVGWMDRRFGLAGKRVLDLGCGPGLYASRMAGRGAAVTGIDFSVSSIAHAAASVPPGTDLAFHRADYLADPLPPGQDIATLIYVDLCALSPDRRATLYRQVRSALAPGGRFVFDALSTGQFAERTEGDTYGYRYMDGFWAPGDYFGFQKTVLYDEQALVLERYLIVEPERTWQVCNWLQYFDPVGLTEELAAHGFQVDAVLDVLSGKTWQPGPSAFFVVARPE